MAWGACSIPDLWQAKPLLSLLPQCLTLLCRLVGLAGRVVQVGRGTGVSIETAEACLGRGSPSRRWRQGSLRPIIRRYIAVKQLRRPRHVSVGSRGESGVS
ncbi:hypothetical protein F4861DRAFT_163063 [Xylaria intraflava]|nr:hypothetical protein F4861DRAFT_163063 [Xylaria intraflava]